LKNRKKIKANSGNTVQKFYQPEREAVTKLNFFEVGNKTTLFNFKLEKRPVNEEKNNILRMSNIIFK
jgi:hypothetical protein